MKKLLLISLSSVMSSVVLWQPPVLAMKGASEPLMSANDQVEITIPTSSPSSSCFSWVFTSNPHTGNHQPLTGVNQASENSADQEANRGAPASHPSQVQPSGNPTKTMPSGFWTTRRKVVAGVTATGGMITIGTLLGIVKSKATALTPSLGGLTTSEMPSTVDGQDSSHGVYSGPQGSVDLSALTTHVLTGIDAMSARYGDDGVDEGAEAGETADGSAPWGETTAAFHGGSSISEDCFETIPASLRPHVQPLVASLRHTPAQAKRDCHLLFGLMALTPQGRFDPTFDVPGFQASLKTMLACQGLSCEAVLNDNLIVPTPTGVMPACGWENVGDFFKYGYGSSCYRSLVKKYPDAQEIADKKTFVCWLNWAMHVVPNDDDAPYALVKQMQVCPFA